MSSPPSGLDRFATAVARLGVRVPMVVAALMAPLVGASAIWFLKNRHALLTTNDLTFSQQLWAAVAPAITLVSVAAAVTGLFYGWARPRGVPFLSFATRLGAFLLPLAAVPFVGALLTPDLEKESPKLALFFCALIATIGAVAAYKIHRVVIAPDRERAGVGRAGTIAAVLAVGLLWAGYSWFFARLSILNHQAFVTRTFDLGIYDNIFYQSIHGRPLGCSIIKAEYHGSAHFDPILVALSPLYLLYPRAELLLGLQAVWCGSGVVPVYLLTRHVLQSRVYGVVLAAAYALHPGLHGANMYEFHSLTLSCVPLLWTLWALHTRRMKLYWVFFAVSLLVREDISLMLIPVGFVSVIALDGKLRRVGLLSMAACAVYFVIARGVFMTRGEESYSFTYYYAEMIPDGKGLLGMLLTLFTNPAFVVTHALREPKLVYAVTVFLPLAFTPFFARSWRLTLLYGLAFTLLATRAPVYSTHFQYTNTLLPFAFAAAPFGIKQLAEGTLATAYRLDAAALRRALVVATLVASATTTYKFGALFDTATFRSGFVKIHRSLTAEQEAQFEWVQEAKAKIPAKASVGVSQKIGPHVSNRRSVYLYGQKPTEYVFVDEKEIKGNTKKKHKKAISEGHLELVTKRGTMALYKDKRVVPGAKKPAAEDDGPADAADVLGDDPRE